MNGDNIAGMKTGNNTLVFLRDEKGTAFGFVYNGTEYYYRFNLQGDIIGIYDNNGSIVARYFYDAWGKILKVTDAAGNINTNPNFIGNINPLRYRGYYYDTESGLYYLQSRYYDPIVSRFLNMDDPEVLNVAHGKILGANLFAYCMNNPVANVDPSGYWAQNVPKFEWGKGFKSFIVPTNMAFLSRAFCLAFAADVIWMKGTWYWWGKGYVGMSLYDLAAECFAHAVFYYLLSIPVLRKALGERGLSWYNSGKIIEVDGNDPRKGYFNALYAAISVVKRIPNVSVAIVGRFGYGVWAAL